MDLDPDKLAELLHILGRIWPEADVTRCNATVFLSEIRLNITVTDKECRGKRR